MFYTALCGAEFVHSAESLDALLAFITDVNDPRFGEDTAVWCGYRIVAVCLSDGRVIRLDGAPPAPPAAPPADLARLDEVAA